MSLNSINTSSPSAVLEILAAQNQDLSGLVNTSDKPITVEINATGEWCLYRPDIAGQTGDMAKFQALVDGDGYNDEALKNPKYKYKYPAANPASLISEIKNAQGKIRRVVAGKKQTFELQPNETVSFSTNDVPSNYRDNYGSLSVCYSISSNTVDILVE